MGKELRVAFDTNFFIALDKVRGFGTLGPVRRLLGSDARFVLVDGVADELLTLEDRVAAFVDDVEPVKALRETDAYQAVFARISRDQVKSSSGIKAKYHADQDLIYWYVTGLRDDRFDPVLVTDDQGMWDAIRHLAGEQGLRAGRRACLMEPFTFLAQFFSSPLLAARERDDLVATTRAMLAYFVAVKKDRPAELARFLGELMGALEMLATGAPGELATGHERSLVEAMDGYVTGALDPTRPADAGRLALLGRTRPVLDVIKALLAPGTPGSALVTHALTRAALVKDLSEVDRAAVEVHARQVSRTFAARQVAAALEERRLGDARHLLEQLLVLRGAGMPAGVQGASFMIMAWLHLAAGDVPAARDLLAAIGIHLRGAVDAGEVRLLGIALELVAGGRVDAGAMAREQAALAGLAGDLLAIGSPQARVLVEALLASGAGLDRDDVERCAGILARACREHGVAPSTTAVAAITRHVAGWAVVDHTGDPYPKAFKEPVDAREAFPGDPCRYEVLDAGAEGTALLLLCWLDKISSRVVVRFEGGDAGTWSSLRAAAWFVADPCTVRIEKRSGLNAAKFTRFEASCRLVITMAPAGPGAITSGAREVPRRFLT